jgi:hypothetical protein
VAQTGLHRSPKIAENPYLLSRLWVFTFDLFQNCREICRYASIDLCEFLRVSSPCGQHFLERRQVRIDGQVDIGSRILSAVVLSPITVSIRGAIG